MDAVHIRANLTRICCILSCIAFVSFWCNRVTAVEGNPPGEVSVDLLRKTPRSVRDDGAVDGHTRVDTNLLRPADSCSASHSQGVNRPLMILSTVDGRILALDIQNAGQQQWSMDAGLGALLSSSISQFEVSGPDGIYKVIPSLDGGLFRWDGETIEAVPFTAETLLSTSFKLNEDTVVVGGKEMKTFGINARTGELHYICGSSGCQVYGDEAGDDQDLIVIQHTRQTVRAVDQRSGSERWNFSVGQHDVTFLEGMAPSEDETRASDGDANVDDDLVCVTEDEDLDCEDDVPTVKVDMAAKTVFALGGTTGRQLLWSHELESCIANAWTIQNGVVSRVDLFERVTLGLTSDTEPRMTPFFTDYASPMLYIGAHQNQLYVQPSPDTQSEVSQAAWAAQRGQPRPQDGSIAPPRVRWRPYAYTSVSRTPSLVSARNEENLEANNKLMGEENSQLTVWNQYPFDNGYYLLHQLSPLHPTHHDKRGATEGNESEDGGLEILFRVSVWTWWKEILTTSVVIAIAMQMFFYCVLKPRRRKSQMEWAEDRVDNEGEERPQTLSDFQEAANGSDSNSKGYKSRYLSDFEHMECLGKGGFGIVFRAKNKVDENKYAVKRITLPNREEAREKVLREARTLAVLDHSGIVRYYNSWLEEPPVGWQDAQDKHFVGESLTSNEALSSMDTPAFFNKNSELVRNREQLLHKTGGSPSLKPCHRARDSPVPTIDLDEVSDNDSTPECSDGPRDPGVDADILFPKTVGKFSEKDQEESGSFSIVFQSGEEFNQNSNSSESVPVNASVLNDNSISNQSTDVSVSGTVDVPFQHYGGNGESQGDLEKSESFQIVFEDSGCNDERQNLDSASSSTFSETSESSKHSATPSNILSCSSKSEGGKSFRGPEVGSSVHSSQPTASKTCLAPPATKVPKVYLYIQMQLCRKETLKDWLSTNTLSRDRNKVLHIFHQILEAVNYIHGCGMIHRDLKPSNIFFAVDGRVKVGDFGLVTAIDTGMDDAEAEKDADAGLHLHTGRVGTQLYMSPEQVTGQNYDHKVDIFALGLIFFELFHPFSTQMERIKVMCQANRQDFPRRFTKELPLEADFARWLLSDNPDHRPDSDEINSSDICTQLYEDYVPPSTHTTRYRGVSNSSR